MVPVVLVEQQGELRHKNSPTQGDRRGHPRTHICTQTGADVQREVIPIPSQLETRFPCQEKKEKMGEISHATLLFLNVCESRHEMQTARAWLPLYVFSSCLHSLFVHERASLSPMRPQSCMCLFISTECQADSPTNPPPTTTTTPPPLPSLSPAPETP